MRGHREISPDSPTYNDEEWVQTIAHALAVFDADHIAAQFDPAAMKQLSLEHPSRQSRRGSDFRQFGPLAGDHVVNRSAGAISAMPLPNLNASGRLYVDVEAEVDVAGCLPATDAPILDGAFTQDDGHVIGWDA
ncbi:hypothetical protein [Mycobacterium kyogaense]|uniref:hypothetical protein n=1 Tax=Mycobacterium kyogaense TaxID=2212479 RepID=UPI0013C50AE4|nr:hypothetical protein [Mycobacterium kyogaense]